ncbi:hypothetical protein AX17_003913 [Amanita inopinata Kibby_2008]|nr:hypothetical protein AX17_003913 [Amanita inopinata Kibby_2008]
MQNASMDADPVLWTLGILTLIFVVGGIAISVMLMFTGSRLQHTLLIVSTMKHPSFTSQIEAILEEHPMKTTWNIWAVLTLPTVLTAWGSLLFALYLIATVWRPLPATDNEDTDMAPKQHIVSKLVIMMTLSIVLSLVAAALVKLKRFQSLLDSQINKARSVPV